MKNSVWAVSMVNNEQDIIGYTISHLISQGVDGIVVLDNGSTDNTIHVLKDLQFKAKIPINIIKDTEGSGYHQSRNMTFLSTIAKSKGADFIIPFDADELWYSNFGLVSDMLRRTDLDSVGFFNASQYFHYCTPMDDPKELNPYKRIVYRTREARPWLKACFRWSPGLIIGSGSHLVWKVNGEPFPNLGGAGLEIRHIPCRSLDQMIEKIIRHGHSMDRQYPNDPSWNGDGPQHNMMYRAFQKSGINALKDIWFNGNPYSDHSGFVLVQDPNKFDLVRDQCPYQGEPYE